MRELVTSIGVIEREKRDREIHLKRLELQLKQLKDDKDSTYQKMKDLVKKRSGKDGGLDSKFFKILAENNVQIQSYHGGALTGGDILNLFDNLDEIFDKLRVECDKVLTEQRTAQNDNSPNPIPTDEEVRKKLDDHHHLFSLQDSVYSCLRIVCPTEEDYEKTEKAIKAMEKKWEEMGMSKTPKSHLLFDHALDDMKKYGGLGDKVEDFLERLHQLQLKLDAVTMRMKGGDVVRLKYQARLIWRDSDPGVRDQIERVHGSTSYRIRRNGRDAHTSKMKRKAERDIKREEAVGR